MAAGGDFERAEALIREAMAELGDAPQFAVHRVNCLLRGSYVASIAGDSPASIERALTARRILDESHQGSPLLDLRVSMDLAEAYRMAGRNREAAAAFEEAYARLAALGRDGTERAGTILNNWALAVHILGHPIEAERLFRRAIAISSADSSERNVSPMLLNNLARVLNELARFPEARSYVRTRVRRGEEGRRRDRRRADSLGAVRHRDRGTRCARAPPRSWPSSGRAGSG